ncbi:hypothetical protein [Treponema putidum]|uniref:Uncharacterized protein n=1 Tax=Treponema putidum TaxID=221027 RepID=A0AAE9MQW2_9SPIR|nr:hypothetical protein [Treponema putidum]UTY33250.1 hypothetical protein E4N74_03910 [Treponema putidum]
MNNNFILNSILKFYQLSNPLSPLSADTEIDINLLKNNTENYSKINLKEYSIEKLPKIIIELDSLINNMQNKDCSYFSVFSFYNTDFVEAGNYAYDNSFKKFIKYSEIKNLNAEYQMSVSFFVSLYNSLYKYGTSSFIKSILAIGEAAGKIKSFCSKYDFVFTENIENFNKTSFDLNIDSLKQLYITTINIKGISYV